MASNRIARINEEIQRQISADIRRLKDPRVSGSGMVSVTRVDTTGDLRYAKIYVSVLDKSQEKDVLKGLKSAGGFLRRELGSALGLRYTPELIFEADDSISLGGLRMVSEDGKIAVDDTLDTRLAAQREWFQKHSGLILS